MRTEEFYQEAEDMQEGWGSRLRHIDELRERVKHEDVITLNEACWLIWADLLRTSPTYLEFKKHAEEKGLNNYTWKMWKNLYYSWEEKDITSKTKTCA